MRSLEIVSNLINCLSSDEDVRQDLWVSYLSGTATESLEVRLSRIKVEREEDVNLQIALQQLISFPIREELQLALTTHFTPYERSIICLLMLGCDVSQISSIKGISEVRIKQTMSTIRYNPSWEELYGVKEETIR